MPQRLPLILAAAASTLALAACGGAKTEPAATETGTATTAATTTSTATGAFPAVPANARTAVKYEGTYTQTGADGRASTLALGPNDSWTMTAADGTVTRGTYNWYSDNSRILIKDGGTTTVYAVADGAVYRLADKDASATGPFTESVTWRRSPM